MILSNGDLVSGGGDGKIKIWNPVDGTLKMILHGHSAVVWTLTSLSNQSFASGSFDSTVKIWG
jgi:WD40 repeat protein